MMARELAVVADPEEYIQLQTALRTLLYICYYITEAEKVQFNFR